MQASQRCIHQRIVTIYRLYKLLTYDVLRSTQPPTQRIRGFLNDMRYINPRFTYLLTYYNSLNGKWVVAYRLRGEGLV